MQSFLRRPAQQRPPRKAWALRGTLAVLATLVASVGLEAQQRKWIFQPFGARTAQASEAKAAPPGETLQDRWIEFESRESGEAVRLHAWWLGAAQEDAPVLLYLHGAQWDLRGSLSRMRHLQSMGFAVLGIDYRGFGRSTATLPSERMACEDALAAWEWLAARHPQSRRFVYGHSLGGAVAVQLAAQAGDLAGLIVEGTFTSIPELFSTMKWGWLPLAPLITQRFDSVEHMARVSTPLLVLHGSDDELIHPGMARALFERARGPKRFVLVPGGSHHDTHARGETRLRAALRDLFGLWN